MGRVTDYLYISILSFYVPQKVQAPMKDPIVFSLSSALVSPYHNHFLVSALRWSFPVSGAFWWRTSRRGSLWRIQLAVGQGVFPFRSFFLFLASPWQQHTFCYSLKDCVHMYCICDLRVMLLSKHTHLLRISHTAVFTKPCPPVVFRIQDNPSAA